MFLKYEEHNSFIFETDYELLKKSRQFGTLYVFFQSFWKLGHLEQVLTFFALRQNYFKFGALGVSARFPQVHIAHL